MNNINKCCISCNQHKLLSKFSKDKSRSDGYMPRCKSCDSKKNKAYHRKNKESVNKKHRKYYQENKESECKRGKRFRDENPEYEKKRSNAYYLNNRECELKRSKEYYNENKDARTKSIKQWRKNNPERVRAIARKRRARKLALNESYTNIDEQYTLELFKYTCAHCGSTKNLTIDHHYPLIKGYPLTKKNAVVLCNICNSSKGTKLPEEFYTKEKLSEISELLK